MMSTWQEAVVLKLLVEERKPLSLIVTVLSANNIAIYIYSRIRTHLIPSTSGASYSNIHQTSDMHNPQSSFLIVGVALLSNLLVSGFSCQAAIPKPALPTTSVFLRKPSSSTTLRKDSINNIFQRQSTTKNIFTSNPNLMVRGGGGDTVLSSSTTASGDNNDGATIVAKELNLTVGSVLSSIWGSCGVVYILAKAIKRVLPIALEPFGKGEGVVPLTQFQLA